MTSEIVLLIRKEAFYDEKNGMEMEEWRGLSAEALEKDGFAYAKKRELLIAVLIHIAFQCCRGYCLPGVASAKPGRWFGRNAETIQDLLNGVALVGRSLSEG